MSNFGWIKAQGDCRCLRCKADIRKGEISFYLPKSNTHYCNSRACGIEVEKDLTDTDLNLPTLQYSNKGMYRGT